ncbi:hypothetical protein [Flavobacterium sp.]|uniref:hypothetical protein n=1 Tax=Flavobacterium sp. TaxID=239 RepID=UPI002FD90B7C
MKKIIPLLALFFIFNSCNTEDSGPRYQLEFLPIESVDIPAEFTLGQTYPITVRFNRPTTCYHFNNLYYEKNLNIRTIAVESAVLQSNDCQSLSGADAVDEYTFNFYVTSNGSYIFKFYQGKDDTGNDIFLQYEVPVN